jgi:hypothetical protein
MFIGGPRFEDYPAETWTHWEHRFAYFLGKLKDIGIPFMCNGDRTLGPYPLYREMAQLNWEFDSGAWVMDGTNKDVLSVYADDTEAVFRLVALAAFHPQKWIAFSGSAEAAARAYVYAAEALGWKVGK